MEKLTQDIFYMNPVDILTHVLLFRLEPTMHFGLADLVDSPTEAWYSAQWAGSIRTTSGQFALYPDSEPISPGDFIEYQCAMQKCGVCRNDNDPSASHTEQVVTVYRDKRQSTRAQGAVGGQASGKPSGLPRL